MNHMGSLSDCRQPLPWDYFRVVRDPLQMANSRQLSDPLLILAHYSPAGQSVARTRLIHRATRTTQVCGAIVMRAGCEISLSVSKGAATSNGCFSKPRNVSSAFSS